MEIYNQTKYDKELIIEYNNYYFMNFVKTKFSLMSLMIIGFSVYLLILGRYSYAALLIVILLSYLLLMFIVQKLSTYRSIKKNPIVDNPFIQEYLFLDEYIIESLKQNITYDKIYKVTISKNFILMFSVEKRTYIVKIDGFKTPEDALKVESFLKDKVIQNKLSQSQKRH